MMTCPNGHSSETTDFCDTCGAALGPITTEIPVIQPTPPTPAAQPVSATSCSHCGSGRTAADKFCEVCGFDFVTGLAAAGPTAAAIVRPAGTAASERPVEWELVVSADRQHYDADVVGTPAFPAHYAERVFALDSDRMLIGRRSESRGVHPQIDLSDAAEDTAISRAHATLLRQADGTYAVVDSGSTNGTYVNDSADPVGSGVEVQLADGDRVRVGAWTVLLIRRRQA